MIPGLQHNRSDLHGNGTPHPQEGDALIVIDPQNDFLPGGALPVSDGHEILGPLQRWIDVFDQCGLSIVVTRDCHPDNHCSFLDQGGLWPSHCILGSHGAEVSSGLSLPTAATVLDKPCWVGVETYDGFSGTHLHTLLFEGGVRRLWFGGLATDYCVLNTVLEALRLGYEAIVICGAVRAVNVHPEDGLNALRQMEAHGAFLHA